LAVVLCKSAVFSLTGTKETLNVTDNKIFDNSTALFHTFGCKLNFAETSTVARIFADAGIRRAGVGEIPDFVVVNTCSVTETADKKCRQAIRAYHRKYPQAAIVVTGCYAQLKDSEVAGLDGVVLVAGVDKKLELADYLRRWHETREQTVAVRPSREIEEFMPSCSRGDDRTRYFLKVQDGCDYWCSYCTIPRARGRSRSGTIGQIVEQARRVAAEGGKEIVITGVNIGDFGKGRDDTFFDLIKALDQVEGIERYRISSIEPNLLTDDIIEWCARDSRKFMPHFHIPLQCGDDSVLRLMRRRYDTSLFRHKVEKIKELMPDAFIGVDVIVGARGESDECFARSEAFLRSIDVSRLHVFVYSERPGTRALELDGAVAPAVQQKRTHRILRLSDEKLRAFSERFAGTVRPALLEHSRAGQPLGGFTDNYLKVHVDAPQSFDNTIVNVRLDRLSDDGEFFFATIADGEADTNIVKD